MMSPLTQAAPPPSPQLPLAALNQEALTHDSLVHHAAALKQLLVECLGREGAIYLLDYVTRKHGSQLSESAAQQFVAEMSPEAKINSAQFSSAFVQLGKLPDFERSKVATLLKYTLTAELCTVVGLHVMNYGFKDGELDPSTFLPHEAPIRYGLKLYQQLAKDAELRGKDTVEIGSGLGAGAVFLARTEAPRTYTGVDLVPAHRDASNVYAARSFSSNLKFVLGDAEAIPLPSSSQDIALNVESLHCYPRPEQFFSEVRRVLRDTGSLHVADFFSESHLDRVLSIANKYGFQLRELTDINVEIQAAIEPHLLEIRKLGAKAPPEIGREFDRIIVTRTFDQPNSNWRNAQVRYWSMRFDRKN